MKLKSKPKPPKRKTINRTLMIDDGVKLSDVIDFANQHNVDPKKVVFEMEYNYGDLSDDVYARLQIPEPEVDFQKRYENYRKRLKLWYEWYNENKAEIKLQKEKDKKVKELQKEYRERMIKIQKMEMKDLS